MANLNKPTRMKVRIMGAASGETGVVTGPGTVAKPGDVVEFDRWTAMHLCAAHGEGTNPIAVPFEPKGGK